MTERLTTYARVAQLVAEVFMISSDDLTEISTANDVPGWDSVSQVTLIMRIEDEFGIELDVSEANATADLQALVELVDARTRVGRASG